MRGVVVVLCILVLVGCQNVQSFSPTGSQTFDPYPESHAVDYYPDKDQIEKPYVVVGIGETRADEIPEALDIFRNMARKNGADAFYGLDSEAIYMAVANYRTTFIRYKEEGDD